MEKILQALGPSGMPRPVVVAEVRRELGVLRSELKKTGHTQNFEAVLARVRANLERRETTRLRPLINATGIPLHTNLGRAPLAAQAVAALTAVASSYNNLEYDLTTGERGSRAAYLEDSLALATGAEAATVVNNCAAALVLMLRHFTRGQKKEVIVSRGELVQIGGGFRVPDILESSGARLREVGTTNRTTAEDFARAIGPETALLLRVHRANFYMGGFVEAPAAPELAALARRRKVPLAEDLGSGALVATERLPGSGTSLGHERTSMEALRDGADLVCFSGDKLLGGPQAGIIVGKARWITALKREPFFRALRADKLILGALEATIDLYLAGRESEIPVLAMLRLEPAALLARAEAMVAALSPERLSVQARVVQVTARVGGGTMPRARLPSVAVELRPSSSGGPPVDEIADRLRRGHPFVAAYVAGGGCRLDLRTVFPVQDNDLALAVRKSFSLE